MNELNIVIDAWGHKELEEYLKSLKGIRDIKIQNDELLDIYLKYDPKLITPKIIKMEILLFLDIKFPSIFSFNKYPKFKTSNYTIFKDDICCEYCFKGAIEDLFEIDGIETVTSDFHGIPEKITINIKYNPNLISNEKMQQIELNLNI